MKLNNVNFHKYLCIFLEIQYKNIIGLDDAREIVQGLRIMPAYVWPWFQTQHHRISRDSLWRPQEQVWTWKPLPYSWVSLGILDTESSFTKTLAQFAENRKCFSIPEFFLGGPVPPNPSAPHQFHMLLNK